MVSADTTVRTLTVFTWLLVALDAGTALAQSCPGPLPGCDPNASVFYVRKSCGTLNNCFTRLEDLAGKWPQRTGPPVHPPTGCATCQTGWLWTTATPTEENPVRIEIGPGVWAPFICPQAGSGSTTPFGHVTVVGAGHQATTLRSGVIAGSEIAIDAASCEDLAFKDLRAEAVFYGVRWSDGGSSYWSDVDISAIAPASGHAIGWVDGCTANGLLQSLGSHFLNNVHVGGGVAAPAGAWLSNCSEVVFAGGSIRVSLEPTGSSSLGAFTIGLLGRPGVRARLMDVEIEATKLGNNVELTAVNVGTGTRLDLQDSRVRVDTELGDATGIRVNSGGELEMHFVDFDLEAGPGGVAHETE